MKPQSSSADGMSPHKLTAPAFVLLTPQEVAIRLQVSLSFLAKARMSGNGPPYIRVGRSVRYAEASLSQWMKSRQRISTSET
jgi:hypothetical protein